MNRTACRMGSFLLLPLILVATGSAAAQTTETPQPFIYNTSVERELSGGQKHVYQARLEAGHYLRVLVDPKNCRLVLAVFGPGGLRLFESTDNLKGVGAETISFIAEVAGDYLLELRLPEKLNLTGQYVIRAEPPRPATAGDQSHVAAVREMAAGDLLLRERTPAAREQAREKYQAALSLFRQTGDRHGEAAILYRFGATYQTSISAPKEAIDYFSQALTLYRELGDRAGQASACNRLGACYLRVGEFPQALEHINKALSLSRELNDRIKEADAFHSVGAAHYETGDYRGALVAHNQALQLRTAVGERLFDLLSNMGLDYAALGEYQQALEYYQRSVDLARAAGNRDSEIVTLNNMGIIYRRLGDEQQALEAFQQALAYWRDMKNVSGQAQVLNNIGNVYRQMMDYPKAADQYTQALVMFRQIGARGGEATALNNLGYISYVQERYQEAIQQYSESHRLRTAGGDRHGEASSLNRLGQVWWRQGEYGKALEALGEALRIHRELNESYDAADVLLNLAAVKRDQGNLTESLTTSEEALKLTELQRATLTSPDLRASYVAAEQEKYQFYIDLLMRLHRQQAGATYNALAFQAAERARARVLLESLVEARLDLREGIDPALLERERAMQRQIHDQSERLSRLLSRKADEQQLGPVRKELERLTTEYQNVETEIRHRSPRYAALTQPRPFTAAEIQQQLDDTTVLLEFALGEKQSWLWAVTRSSIDSYQLAPGNEIESRARKVYESLTARQPRRGETDEQYKTRITNAEKRLQTESAMLSQILLGQIGTKLQQEWKDKRLAIVATGALEYIPFAALPAPNAGRQEKSDKQPSGIPNPQSAEPLIAQHEVVNLPSASALATIRRETAGRKRAERNLAIIADPVFEANDPRLLNALKRATNNAVITGVRSGSDGPSSSEQAPTRPDADLARSLRGFNLFNERGGFQRLPFSREEADAIASLTPPNSLMKATDFQANRQVATSGELSRYRIVHFATHGLLNSQRPELSGLVLSLLDETGKPQDGFLRMQEIYNLKLPADLIVLSACQTALGKEIKGEGLVGLTRGFMYAGAQRVVASLWQVDDLATAELMKRFYRGMLKDGLRPAQSLRQAQLEMLKQKRWSSPFFWASFSLQGEWK